MNTWGKLGREYYTWYVEDMQELETFIIDHNIDVDYCNRSLRYMSTLKYQVGRFTWDEYSHSVESSMLIGLFAPISAVQHGPGQLQYIWIDRARIF
jgi:hypothetical protein